MSLLIMQIFIKQYKTYPIHKNMIILKNSIGILNKDTPRSENIGLIIEVIIFIHLFLRIFFP